MANTALEITLRTSEVRERLNAISAMDDITPEVREETETLRKEFSDLEVRDRAAAIAQEADAEARLAGEPAEPADPAYGELLTRAALSDVFAASWDRADTDGATRELQDELGLESNVAPIDLLRARTSGQTSIPSDTGASQQSIIAAVFPRSATMWLGVDQPRVPVGDRVFTVLSTNLAPGLPAGGAEQDDSAGAFTATVMSPSRIQGSFFFRREDRATLMGMESALRENLNDAMTTKMDSEVVAGTDGFLGTGLADPTNPTADVTYAGYRGLVFDADVVDGLYCYSAGEVRVLLGPATYAHAAGVYRGNNDNTDALAALMRDTGGVMVSSHIPAPPTSGTNANDQGLLLAKDVGRRHSVAPIWEGVEIITDPYTQSKEGEIRVTAVMLWGGLEVLRTAGYSRKEVQLG